MYVLSNSYVSLTFGIEGTCTLIGLDIINAATRVLWGDSSRGLYTHT
jgi:hypothetical protein